MTSIRSPEAVIARLALRTYRPWHETTLLGMLKAGRIASDLPKRPISLRLHLFAVVIVAIMPALGLAVFSAASASRYAAHARQFQADDTAGSLAAAVDQALEFDIASLQALAAGSSLTDDGDNPDFTVRAELAAETSGTQILLRRPDGHELRAAPARSHTDPAPALNSPALQALDAEVVRNRQMALSEVPVSPTNLPVTALAVPVVRDGAVLATLAMIIPADRLSAVLRHQTRQEGGMAILVDPQGRIAAASRGMANPAGQTLRPKVGQPGTAWPGPILPPTSTRARAFLSHAPGWQVLYSEEGGPTLITGHVLGESMLVGLFAALLGIGFASLLSGQLTRRLCVLTDLAAALATGGKSPAQVCSVAQVSSVAEFEELRQGMVRADAVLRRRTAAERMALREARTGHDLLMSVLNGTAESIHVKDLELRTVLVNRAALESGQQTRAEWQVLGKDAAGLFPPPVARRIEAADRSVLATGKMASFEQDYRVETGPDIDGTRWISMTVAPWMDATGAVVGVVSVSRDVTQKRAGEARLRAVQADLLRATRLSAMGAMASGLAHEINQPLAAAANYLNAGGRLLDRGILGDPTAFRSARGAVTEAAQQMLRAGTIVRRLRDFVERGEVELQPEDVADLLREACDLARSDGLAAGIALRMDFGREPLMVPLVVPLVVIVDRTQIQQVLLNLIRNAAEAIAGADTIRSGEIVVRAEVAPDGGVRIEVVDNGPGLPPGLGERLFQPFVSSKLTGMGIGLSICRTIIEGHGGRLTAHDRKQIQTGETKTGETLDGTTTGMLFRIDLPPITTAGDHA